jgi:hypothetical protein
MKRAAGNAAAVSLTTIADAILAISTGMNPQISQIFRRFTKRKATVALKF